VIPVNRDIDRNLSIIINRDIYQSWYVSNVACRMQADSYSFAVYTNCLPHATSNTSHKNWMRVVDRRVHVLATAREVNRAAAYLLRPAGVVNPKSADGVRVLGFDTEWTVTYRKGEAPRATALIQLCTGDNNNNKHAYAGRLISFTHPRALLAGNF
jgi:hypothetical protein